MYEIKLRCIAGPCCGTADWTCGTGLGDAFQFTKCGVAGSFVKKLLCGGVGGFQFVTEKFYVKCVKKLAWQGHKCINARLRNQQINTA